MKKIISAVLLSAAITSPVFAQETMQTEQDPIETACSARNDVLQFQLQDDIAESIRGALNGTKAKGSITFKNPMSRYKIKQLTGLDLGADLSAGAKASVVLFKDLSLAKLVELSNNSAVLSIDGKKQSQPNPAVTVHN